MPTAKIRTTDSPMGRVRTTDSPMVRLRQSSFYSSGNLAITIGTPIGLLLALTYAENLGISPSGEAPQYVRIRNTD